MYFQKSILLIGTVSCFALVSSQVDAATVTGFFTATVTDVYALNANDVPEGVAVGSTVTGTVTYDSDVAELVGSSGDYRSYDTYVDWQFPEAHTGELSFSISTNTWDSGPSYNVYLVDSETSTGTNTVDEIGISYDTRLHETATTSFPGSFGQDNLTLWFGVETTGGVNPVLLSSVNVPETSSGIDLTAIEDGTFYSFGSIVSQGADGRYDIVFEIDDGGVNFEDVVKPIADIASREYSGSVTSSSYSWDSAFDWEFVDGDMFVSVDVNLSGDVDAALALNLLDTWKTTIETEWGSYDIIDGDFKYDLLFDVNFVNGEADHDVDIIDGFGHTNKTTWYLETEWDDAYQGLIAAHEFGHMLGLYDEYLGGAVDPDSPPLSNCDSFKLMMAP